METRKLEVKLISYPIHPMGTLFYVWEQSRTNDPVPSPREIELILDFKNGDFIHESHPLAKSCRMLGEYPGSKGEYNIGAVRTRVQAVIDQILDEDIPCTENLNFVFAIENMSISLREQMVRHRIGVTIGERVGMDIVPEASKSSWWSQTMRMLPMDKFMSEGRLILPESLKGKDIQVDFSHGDCRVGDLIVHEEQIDAQDLYLALMEQIEFVYNKMIEAGVAMEDARQIIPIGASHGITWSVNLKALMHIVGKRACWVAQANLWEALISGMVDQLCEHVSPKLRKIILPPCFKKGTYKGCPYFQINRERVQGRDHMPPCPLYVYHETESSLEAARESVKETGKSPTWLPPGRGEMAIPINSEKDIRNWESTEEVEVRMLHENIERFERLWKLDVLTGTPLVAPASPEEDDSHMYEGFQS